MQKLPDCTIPELLTLLGEKDVLIYRLQKLVAELEAQKDKDK